MALTSDQKLTAALANTLGLPGTVIVRGRRTSNATGATSTTLVPFLRLDDVPITAGRLYRIFSSGIALDGSVASDIGQVSVTYTTDGSTPTISSTVLPGGIAKAIIPNTTHAEYVVINTTYTPAANETLSLLFSVSRLVGTGTITPLGLAPDVLELCVVDCGVDPGDTGVDV